MDGSKDKDKPKEVPPQRFTVLSYEAVATVAEDNRSESCTVCCKHLQDVCIECQADYRQKGCEVVRGECGHAFHTHCIARRIKRRGRPVCPEDNKDWKVI